MSDADGLPEIPEELRPESPEQYQHRRHTMWLGIGIPTLMGAVMATALGVPWWIVALVVVGVGVGTFLGT